MFECTPPASAARMDSHSRTGLLNELLANNKAYAKTFDKPMSLGVKKKVGWLLHWRYGTGSGGQQHVVGLPLPRLVLLLLKPVPYSCCVCSSL